MTVVADIYYDRRVSAAFLERLAAGGPLHWFVKAALPDRLRLDVQLRATPKSSTNHASLYFGLTTLLDIHRNAKGQCWLDAHPTHRAGGGFERSWATPRPVGEVGEFGAVAQNYLDLVRSASGGQARYMDKEGRVQAAMCSGLPTTYRVIDREASTGFLDRQTQTSICVDIEAPIRRAVARARHTDRWWSSLRDRPRAFGSGLDVLAVDGYARLLVIEVKAPGSTGGIGWAPAQVRFYAELFSRWWHACPSPGEVLDGMLAQRAALGLQPPWPAGRWPASPTIVPVVAIGAEDTTATSPVALPRLWQLDEVLNDEPHLGPGIAPLEVWRLDAVGEPTPVERP